MAGELHFYLVASGAYVPTAVNLAPEIWQFGLRLLVAPGGQPDMIGPLTDNFDIVPDSIDRDETGWTITGNWRAEGGVNDFSGDDFLNDQAGPALRNFINNSAVAFSNQVQLRELRLYPIAGPDGHVVPAPPYAQGTPIILTYKSPPAGTNGGMMPLQTSLVASLRTQQIGRRGRGRIYLPPLASSVMASSGTDAGTVAAATRAAIGAQVGNMLKALQLKGTGPNSLWAACIVTGAPYTAYSIINQVRIGNTIDTQKRRRASIAEVYSSTAVSVF